VAGPRERPRPGRTPVVSGTLAALTGAGLAVGATLAACQAGDPGTGEAPAATTVLERDSAAVRIVEFALPGGLELRELAPDTAWVRRLEAAHGGPFAFGHLLDLDVAPDGRVALLDDMNVRVTLVDPGGEGEPASARTSGRAGEGPGELSPYGLVGIVVTDTSVVVPDLQLVRVTEYDWTGELLGSRPLTDRSGELVAAFDWRRHPNGGMVWRHQRPADHRIVHARDGATDTLLVVHLPSAGPNVLLETMLVWDAGPGGALAIARTDRREVRWFAAAPGHADAEGAGAGEAAGPVRIVRWTEAGEGVEGAPIPEADRNHLDRLLLSAMERDGSDRLPPDQVERILASVNYAERTPVIAGLFVGEDGRTWVRLAAPVAAMGQEALRVGAAAGWGGDGWLLLDEEGRPVERLRIPGSFTPRRLLDGCLYGIQQNELGERSPARYCHPG
jgi:hypothetical protein